VRLVIRLVHLAPQLEHARAGWVEWDLLAGLCVSWRAAIDSASLARVWLVRLSLWGADEEPAHPAVLVLGNRVAEVGAGWTLVHDGRLGVDVEGEGADGQVKCGRTIEVV